MSDEIWVLNLPANTMQSFSGGGVMLVRTGNVVTCTIILTPKAWSSGNNVPGAFYELVQTIPEGMRAMPKQNIHGALTSHSTKRSVGGIVMGGMRINSPSSGKPNVIEVSPQDITHAWGEVGVNLTWITPDTPNPNGDWPDPITPAKKAQIRHMLEPNPRTGLVGAYQDNEADFTARINALEFLKTNWFPGGSQLTAMDNIYFVAYAIQDIFPYIFQNWNSLDPLDIFYLFHNDDLIYDGQDLLIWDGKPQEFITIYNGMRDDLKKPQTHQLFTGWDKQVFILGDDNFSLENTTMGIVWDGKLMSITVEDGLKELDPQELINLFDTPPTRMAILRII